MYPLWESNTWRGQAHDLWCSAAIPIHCSEVLVFSLSVCTGRQSQVLICYTFIGLNDTYQCLDLNLSGWILFCRYFYKRLVKPCCHGQSLFSRRQVFNGALFHCTPLLWTPMLSSARNACQAAPAHLSNSSSNVKTEWTCCFRETSLTLPGWISDSLSLRILIHGHTAILALTIFSQIWEQAHMFWSSRKFDFNSSSSIYWLAGWIADVLFFLSFFF